MANRRIVGDEIMENYHMCDTCNRYYKFKKNLIRHIKENHTERQYFPCVYEHCRKEFKRIGYLKTHLIKVHKLKTEIAEEMMKTEAEDEVNNNKTVKTQKYDPELEDISSDELEELNGPDVQTLLRNIENEQENIQLLEENELEGDVGSGNDENRDNDLKTDVNNSVSTKNENDSNSDRMDELYEIFYGQSEDTDVDIEDNVSSVDTIGDITDVDVDDNVSSVDTIGDITDVDIDDNVSSVDTIGDITDVDIDDDVSSLDTNGDITNVDIDDDVSSVNTNGDITGVDIDDDVSSVDTNGDVTDVHINEDVSGVNADDGLSADEGNVYFLDVDRTDTLSKVNVIESVTSKTVYTYRGSDVIHTEHFVCADKWFYTEKY